MDPYNSNNYLNYGFSMPNANAPAPYYPVSPPVMPYSNYGPGANVHQGFSYPNSGGVGNDQFNGIKGGGVSMTGQLFEDQSFPATNSSLFPTKAVNARIVWKRPHEITRNPKFFVDGASRFDVRQGELGDCWLLAAVSNLTLHPKLFNNIVSPGQSFEHNYTGRFNFRFWQYGEWVDVVVDDRLPTENGKLAFMRSTDPNEFWSALFEKAYAKLHGSYEALAGGRTSTAMDDFTGGVSELFNLKENKPPNLFDIMLKGFERGSLMACSIEPNPGVHEQRLGNGLIRGHAYSITSVKYCEVSTPRSRDFVPLIRIRNPWGNEAEWTGPWSDQSQEWRYVSQQERSNLGLTFDHDGEFWMSFSDFTANFHDLEMTNINLESLTEKDIHNQVKHRWEVKKFDGSWVRGVTAGGCANHPNTFWSNPKYYITLKDEDDGDHDNKCTMIVALLQKPKRESQRKDKFLTIGFSVHPVPPNILSNGALNEAALRKTMEIRGPKSYMNQRQVSFRYNLTPGTYCVVPSTYNPDEESSFMLRVFCEKPNTASAIEPKIGFVGLDPKVMPKTQPSAANEAEARMKIIFDKIAGADKEIDWRELQTLLNKRFETQSQFRGFSKDACRSMVAMLDFDKSGKLGFAEFIHLWNIICIWKDAFKHHDRDGSGLLSGFEFRDALLTSGFQISNNLFASLLTIYGDETKQISFDDFVLCSIRMSKAFKAYSEKDIARTNTATFTIEEFLENTVCM